MLDVIDLAYLHNDFHISILGEFECVGLQTQQYLHHSLLVSLHHGAVGSERVLVFLTDVHKGWIKIRLVIFSFPLLDNYHVSHCLYNVKLLHVRSEFALLDLGKVKHVLYHKLEAEWAWFLHLQPVVKLLENKLALLNQFACIWIDRDLLLKLSQCLFKLNIEVLFLNIMSNDAVQGVSHLMGDTSIYHF